MRSAMDNAIDILLATLVKFKVPAAESKLLPGEKVAGDLEVRSSFDMSAISSLKLRYYYSCYVTCFTSKS